MSAVEIKVRYLIKVMEAAELRLWQALRAEDADAAEQSGRDMEAAAIRIRRACERSVKPH